jgi:hypothetical protein
MDVDGVRAVELVQALRAQGTAFIVVSHYLQMIESLQPDAVLRLDQGCIAETGDLELARAIARTGFARAGRPWRPEHGQRPRRHPGARQTTCTHGWIRAAANPFATCRRRRWPMAGAQASRLRRARPGRRRLDAAPRSAGDRGASGVDARWLMRSTPPSARAVCRPARPGPADGEAAPFAWAPRAVRQGLRLRISATPGKEREPWLHLRHQPRAQAGGAAGARGTRACAAC